MSERLIRCESPAQVELIAKANHLPYESNRYAASVTLAGIVYFYSAA